MIVLHPSGCGKESAVELLVDRICQELALPRAGVTSVAALLAEGNTVPFIARYRKEATGSLDEVAIRAVEDRLAYYRELLDRRESVLKSIQKQGKLTPELKAKVEAAWTKTDLEDLYLPYKPKKRTKATDARERGLEPLLDALLADESGADPLMLAAPFVQEGQEGLEAPSACLEGAGHILAERLAEDAEVRAWLRQVFHDTGVLHVTLREERKEAPEALRFKPYWQFQEPLRKMPGHRILAVRRGEKEEILAVKLAVDRERLVTELVSRVPANPKSAYRAMLHDVCADAFDRLLAPGIETDVRIEAKKKADVEAIKVFQTNLDHLLLAPRRGSAAPWAWTPASAPAASWPSSTAWGSSWSRPPSIPWSPSGTWRAAGPSWSSWPGSTPSRRWRWATAPEAGRPRPSSAPGSRRPRGRTCCACP
jgi:uncharacterized protein